MPSKNKSPYGGTFSLLGGEGEKKDVKCPNLKYLFTRELFHGGRGGQVIISVYFLNKKVKSKFLIWKGKS